MCYFLARQITENTDGFAGKVLAMRDFVHENIHPVTGYDNRLDTVAIDKLMSGIGWCDQQARVFMQLAASLEIHTRLLFLKIKSGPSPHSIAEAMSPDKRWIIVDPYFKLDLFNKRGELASQSDVKEDFNIIKDNKRVKLRAKFEKLWNDDTYLSMYANAPRYITTKKETMIDFLRPVPLSWLRPIVNAIQESYIERNRSRIKDPYEIKMIKAQGYRLLGYYAKSAILYNDIINNAGNPKLKWKARFYRALSLKEEGKYPAAYRYITDIINESGKNSYLEYLYGLRSSVLVKMGRPKDAESDLEKINYSMEAS